MFIRFTHTSDTFVKISLCSIKLLLKEKLRQVILYAEVKETILETKANLAYLNIKTDLKSLCEKNQFNKLKNVSEKCP